MSDISKPLVFLPGQIIKEKQGERGVVVVEDSKDRKSGTQRVNNSYGAFVYEPLSDEFRHLTGVRLVQNDVKRVYFGVSVDAANDVARACSDCRDDDSLRNLDRMVVEPFFMPKIE